VKAIPGLEIDEIKKCGEFAGKHICNKFETTDQCDVCDGNQKLFTNLTVELHANAIASRKNSANDTLDVPWRTEISNISNNKEYAIEGSLENACSETDGEVVLSLEVPNLTTWTGLNGHTSTLTPDSDKDSGVFSEEQSVAIEALDATDKEISVKIEGTQLEHDTKFEHERIESLDDYEYSASIGKATQNVIKCPFERKIWKRRNGRYKVRNPTCPPPIYKAIVNYVDHEKELGSERSSMLGLNYREHFEFLGDTESSKEFSCVIGNENNAVNQGVPDRSENRQNDTAKCCTKGNDQPENFSNLSDFQMKLNQMKLEIAEMVAEAAELDNLLSDSENDSDDVIQYENVTYNTDHENLESETESIESLTASEEDSEDDLSEGSQFCLACHSL